MIPPEITSTFYTHGRWKRGGSGFTRTPMRLKIKARNRRKRHQKRGRKSAVRGSRAK